ncbi:MAG TPA: hypothetical protein PKN04_01055 [bacterium]|jgi:hypothetical protein|nr:hypothetical protein [bacterium]HNT64347.1 hypothetical protein [bacterium]HOX85337.1 hypothetical protein [bacterium]HPG44496.1 hypothetical protein [bacterium]HPM97054.1 hypothetical protein [bacterium]
MEKHLSLVAALHIGLSIMAVLIGLFVFVLLTGIGFIADDAQAQTVLTLIGSIASFFLIITAIPGLIGGIGLLRRKNWARLLVLVVSAINLLNIPIGTALGIYSIWVLVNEDTNKLLAKKP